jgi:hypothetical protein
MDVAVTVTMMCRHHDTAGQSRYTGGERDDSQQLRHASLLQQKTTDVERRQ